MARHKLRGDRRITLTLELLESLSAADDQRISAAAFAREHGIGLDDVCELAGLAATLADRNSGARAIVTTEGDRISLEGAAAKLYPTRLSAGEGAVLAYALDLLELDDDCKHRIESALMPFGLGDTAPATVTSALNVGAFYQQLSAAIVDGVRCAMRYRSARDAEPTPRIIDPLSFETTATAAYLLAWDIDAGAERRYRLDRIAELSFTEDSVTAHKASPQKLADSLAEYGTLVELAMPSDIARDLTWQGIVSRSYTEGEARITVAVTSRTWLFDQLLSLGNGARIVNSPELQQEFRAYAKTLVIGRI